MSAPAEIRLLPDPAGGPAEPEGPVKSVQEAELELPLSYLEEHWQPESLERLARAYWAFLERISLGALKVRYGPASRTVALFGRISLLRFRRPRYAAAIGLGQVTWPIERGILVSPGGRGRGYLRITIRRLADVPVSHGRAVVRVSAEVSNFYPGLRLSGLWARLGAWVYNQTQLRLHVLVTRGFLRSLARLELPPSRVGALRREQEPAAPAAR